MFFPVGKEEEDTNGLRAEIERLEEQMAELEDDIKYLSSDKDSLQAENKVSLLAHFRHLF